MKAHERTNFGILGQRSVEKLTNDNDVKIIIQGANSATGIGKTTLAIQLCRFLDENGWSAEGKAFIDIQKYLNAYLDVEPKSALLLDEIGKGADSRRATSTDNVELSHGWQMLRAMNVATVATLPSTSTLDFRMLELADYWILVKKRGLAQPFEIRVNDFNGNVARRELPGEEHIRFADLPDGDDDKQYLDEIKDEQVREGGMKSIKVAEHQKVLKDEKAGARKQERDEIIRSLYHETDLSYADIGDIPAIDLTKQTVGQIVRGE